MSEIEIRRGDQWPEQSGWYVAWLANCINPVAAYFNRRDHRWFCGGYRVTVTHYENRRLKERREA